MRWILAAFTLVPSFASAHVTLTSPTPRTTAQKDPVCGVVNGARANVTTIAPGSTITVEWLETVDHPGHYRIAFDDDGEDFPVPPTELEGASAGMPTVMIDPITDIQDGMLPAGGRPYSQQITLPNIECENCTLQLIQMMTDKLPYTATIDAVAADDIYYQCADIRLSNSAPPPMPDAGVPDDGGAMNPAGNGGDLGGCSAGTGAGLLGALALVGLRRRKRH